MVQLRGNVQALRDQGVDAVAADWSSAPPDADIVHLYNVQSPFLLVHDARQARQRWPGARLVVTPIFWPPRTLDGARTGDVQAFWRTLKSTIKLTGTLAAVRSVLASADLVMPVTETEAGHLRRFYRLPRSLRTVVVPLGADFSGILQRAGSDGARMEWRAEIGLSAKVRHVVACAGDINPNKNQLALVEAISRLPEWGLVLAGNVSDEPYQRHLTGHANRLLGARWTWAGRLARDDVWRMLSMVDVHALVSLREVAGYASVEAAAAGCEVVVTSTGSAPELFGDNAHYCRPYDVESIAAAMEDALATPRQPTLAAHARRFDWRAIAPVLAAAYEGISAGRE
jgi:glycosyltransferase involved in cell wall biosynthesis